MSGEPRKQDAEGEQNLLRTSRRTVLRAVGAAGVGAATLTDGLVGSGAAADTETSSQPEASSRVHQRVTEEYNTRITCARSQLMENAAVPHHPSNDRVSDQAVVSKFGKSLAHDHETGLPTAEAYDSLVTACERGDGYEQIQQASLESYDIGHNGFETIDPPPIVEEPRDLSPKPLLQPETAWTYMNKGGSTAQLQIASPPAFDSQQTGAEMVELYWRALNRDVPFHEYKRNDEIRDAAVELNSVDGYRGPGSEVDATSDGVHTGNVFRGIVPGAQTGPYVSQFLWKDRELSGGTEDQKIEPQTAETTPQDYLTTVEDWLKIQNGVVPAVDRNLPGNEYADTRRHIITGRDLCEEVHNDTFRQVQKAAQVLLFSMRAPLDPAIPYTLKPFEKRNTFDDVVDGTALVDETESSRRNIDTFLSQTCAPIGDFGPLYIEKRVLEASEHGQKAAWHKKWNVHRRLRPEEYGARVQTVTPGSDSNGRDFEPAVEYPIPDNLLNSEALERSERRFGSSLLPQAYAEGSPTHPSYPAGHAVVAGAGVTVLKALFDGDYVFPADEKVVPSRDGRTLMSANDIDGTSPLGHAHDIYDELTVRGELNKLASNMALGRNFAGIHYRSDGIEGLRLGETAAIRFLEDQLSLTDRVGDVRLSLETFDGERLTLEPTT